MANNHTTTTDKNNQQKKKVLVCPPYPSVFMHRIITSSMLHDIRVTYITPSLSLLRSTFIQTSFPECLYQIIKDKDTIDFETLQHTFHNNDIPTSFSYAATLTLDACLMSSPNNNYNNNYNYNDVSWKSIMSPVHFPCVQNDIHNIAWCQNMDQKNPFVYLMTKTVVQRCMTRKFNIVALRIFRDSLQTCAFFKWILLLSLLGNYDFNLPSSRPLSQCRKMLYDRLMHQDHLCQNHHWFVFLVRHCPYLIEFAAREFLCYHIKNDLSLQKHVNLFIPVDQFLSVVIQAMNLVRQRFALHISLSSSLFMICQDIQIMLYSFHSALLSMSYRVPKSMSDILSHFTSIRESEVTMSGEEEKVNERNERNERNEEEKEKEEEMIHNKKKNRGRGGGGGGRHRHYKQTVVENKFTAFATAKKILKPEVLETLLSWVRCAVTRRQRDALYRVMELFPLLGASYLATKNLRNVTADYVLGSINRTAFPVTLREIQRQDTYLYNLLNITVDMFHIFQRITVIKVLPVHIVNAQIRALKKNLCLAEEEEKEKTDSFVYDTVLELVWCPICDQICTVFRTFQPDNNNDNNHHQTTTTTTLRRKKQTNKKHKSKNPKKEDEDNDNDNDEEEEDEDNEVDDDAETTMMMLIPKKKKKAQFGLRNIVVDYDTDYIFCRNTNENVLGKCGAEPLIRFPFLGLIYRHNGTDLMLCTSCASPMVLNTRLAYFDTEGGPTCSKCTVENRGNNVQVQLNELKELEYRPNKKCYACANPLPNPSTCYMYGKDLYLCTVHHKQAKKTHALDTITERGGTTQERQTIISDMHRQYKNMNVERNKSKWKFNLQRHKLQTYHSQRNKR